MNHTNYKAPTAANVPIPDLALYNVYAAANTTVSFELLDERGKTVATGSITVGATARALGYLITQALGGTTEWNLAVGAILSITGAGPVKWNTAGSNSDGTTPVTSSVIGAVSTAIRQWTTGNQYAIGSVS